jgi:hypothetical protein
LPLLLSRRNCPTLGSHVPCFVFFGGTTQILAPNNLRNGVTKAHRYEPGINPSYRDLAEHYGVAVLPARSRKHKDKAEVEVGVQVVERWILAVLRNRQFFSLGELNTAIALLLDRLNHKPFKKLPGSRRSALEALDQLALQGPVRLCQMEKGTRPYRLPHQGRWPLLLGTVRTGEAPTRSTIHRAP